MMELLKQSWPILLSTIAITIYSSLDQVLVGLLVNFTEVGIFTTGLQLLNYGILFLQLLPNQFILPY